MLGKLRSRDVDLFRTLKISLLILSLFSCNSKSVPKISTDATPVAITYLAGCSAGGEWSKRVKPDLILINQLSPCMNTGFGDKIEISEWTTWLPYVATGIGRFGVNTVVPSGANENYIFYEVTVTLDSPINGFFSRMHLSWSTKPPTAQATYQIQPMSFEEGALQIGRAHV